MVHDRLMSSFPFFSWSRWGTCSGRTNTSCGCFLRCWFPSPCSDRCRICWSMTTSIWLKDEEDLPGVASRISMSSSASPSTVSPPSVAVTTLGACPSSPLSVRSLLSLSPPTSPAMLALLLPFFFRERESFTFSAAGDVAAVSGDEGGDAIGFTLRVEISGSSEGSDGSANSPRM